MKHSSRYTRSLDRNHCSVQRTNIPQQVDWRKFTTKVKNQKNCGSCWALVASEQIETYWGRKEGGEGGVRELSGEELLSCSVGSRGCGGGNTCRALYWLTMTQQPVVSETTYPYQGQPGTPCDLANKLQQSGGEGEGVRVKGVCGCHPIKGREHIMLQVLAQKGPLAVNVDALSWHDYVGGVVQHHCTSTNMNHAVQIVGYNLQSPIPYYIVRNQWGGSFGEHGYMRIKYGSNVCGVAQQPSYVIV